MPFGGYKESGLGRELGEAALVRTYLQCNTTLAFANISLSSRITTYRPRLYRSDWETHFSVRLREDDGLRLCN